MVDAFHGHVKTHLTRLRQYIYGTYVELPPRVSHVSAAIRNTLCNMSEVARQHLARHIIPDLGRGRTGSLFTGESGQHLMGKQCSVGKAMHKARIEASTTNLRRTTMDPRSANAQEKRHLLEHHHPMPRLCVHPVLYADKKGHRSTECKLHKDQCVPIEKLPTDLHDSARSVRNMIKRD